MRQKKFPRGISRKRSCDICSCDIFFRIYFSTPLPKPKEARPPAFNIDLKPVRNNSHGGKARKAERGKSSNLPPQSARNRPSRKIFPTASLFLFSPAPPNPHIPRPRAPKPKFEPRRRGQSCLPARAQRNRAHAKTKPLAPCETAFRAPFPRRKFNAGKEAFGRRLSKFKTRPIKKTANPA
ncbi:MAG: hypothetical protein DBX55_09130 [Verrucomicrobia bacterium]|nr:MAG: hypothetical protein DBX55_09130 [Verrucomicrobiota bacterium]